MDLLKESSRAHQAPGTVSRAGVRQIRNSGEAIGIAGVGEDKRRVSGLKGFLERGQASFVGEGSELSLKESCGGGSKGILKEGGDEGVQRLES